MAKNNSGLFFLRVGSQRNKIQLDLHCACEKEMKRIVKSSLKEMISMYLGYMDPGKEMKKKNKSHYCMISPGTPSPNDIFVFHFEVLHEIEITVMSLNKVFYLKRH